MARLDNWPKLIGNGPLRPLCDKYKIVKLPKLPRLDGIRPVIEQNLRSRICSEGATLNPNHIGIGFGRAKFDALNFSKNVKF